MLSLVFCKRLFVDSYLWVTCLGLGNDYGSDMGGSGRDSRLTGGMSPGIFALKFSLKFIFNKKFRNGNCNSISSHRFLLSSLLFTANFEIDKK